jgi:hypothetical protein
LKDDISNQIAPWFSSGLIFKGLRRGIEYELSWRNSQSNP